MKVVIIDDEDNGRNIIRQYLSLYCDDVDIMGEANSVKSGVEMLSEITPDVLFLDIQMQDGTGFDLLEALPQRSFKVIFVTSYDQFALKAIKFNAADYILKPVDPDEFVEAVQRVQADLAKEINDNRIDQLLTNMDNFTRVGFPTDEGVLFVDIDDIVRCEADGGNTQVFTDNGTMFVATKNIKVYEELFADNKFLRINKTNLINTSYIDKYEKSDGGGSVLMADGVSIEVSPYRKDDLQKMLNS
ncbi:MAG: response regulator transcription factor [Salinivirgaceae bacterium]|nr:response regulator transcription factor [Salinivirgaceae bacterium]